MYEEIILSKLKKIKTGVGDTVEGIWDVVNDLSEFFNTWKADWTPSRAAKLDVIDEIKKSSADSKNLLAGAISRFNPSANLQTAKFSTDDTVKALSSNLNALEQSQIKQGTNAEMQGALQAHQQSHEYIKSDDIVTVDITTNEQALMLNEGYLNKNINVQTNISNLRPENIVRGVNVGGVVGTRAPYREATRDAQKEKWCSWEDIYHGDVIRKVRNNYLIYTSDFNWNDQGNVILKPPSKIIKPANPNNKSEAKIIGCFKGYVFLSTGDSKISACILTDDEKLYLASEIDMSSILETTSSASCTLSSCSSKDFLFIISQLRTGSGCQIAVYESGNILDKNNWYAQVGGFEGRSGIYKTWGRSAYKDSLFFIQASKGIYWKKGEGFATIDIQGLTDDEKCTKSALSDNVVVVAQNTNRLVVYDLKKKIILKDYKPAFKIASICYSNLDKRFYFATPENGLYFTDDIFESVVPINWPSTEVTKITKNIKDYTKVKKVFLSIEEDSNIIYNLQINKHVDYRCVSTLLEIPISSIH